MPETTRIASVSWEGDSWEVLKSWPKAIRWDFGNSLREMQYGRSATLNVRPMRSIGQGVFELKDSDENTWYRMVYLKRVGDVIYVLDCFREGHGQDRAQGLEQSEESFVGG
ncbi:MAG TPA: type II toxin-antitoxin system RelE/ParE family toxin [Candidatus Angelobacter sp.]